MNVVRKLDCRLLPDRHRVQVVDRDAQFNIPARPIERFQLSLSAGELAKLRYSLLLALPGVAALLGLIVYWTRRR